MHQRKKAVGGINVHGWMMSYADMATILLAMFIVLSTLGKDQTGVSLQRGVLSFANARHSFGLPGLFSTSAQPIAMQGPTPHYAFGRRDEALPDKQSEPKRILDGDEEHLQRFLQEFRRQFPCERRPAPSGEMIVDLYEPLRKRAPFLATKHTDLLHQMAPFLNRPDYHVQLIVWAGTPAPTAWTRAANQAAKVAQEYAADAELDEPARQRLIPVGQPWRYRDIRRPVLSLVLTKQE